MGRLRVALLQLLACGADREANLRNGEAACRRAAEAGADVALFPELWSIGFAGFDPADAQAHRAWLDLALRRDDACVLRFADLARELDLAIALTYLEQRPEGPPRNALTVFDRRGRAALHYAKVHLGPWNPPDSACAAGDALPVAALDTRSGSPRVGAMICFDREFPETARVLALAGAELVLVPNACPLARDPEIGDVRTAQLRARAFENLLPMATANYAAPQEDGHSLAVGPDGGVLVQAGEAEEIVLAEIDLDAARRFREREAGRDAARRPELYGPISSPGGGARGS